MKWSSMGKINVFMKIGIIGTGFKGMMDAWELSKNEEHEVYIFDKSKEFGGISRSIEMFGFNIDLGVHMFDSVQKELYFEVEKVLEGNIMPIDFISQSCYNNIVTDGFSLPDLSHESEENKKKIKDELLKIKENIDETKEKIKNSSSLSELFSARYGATAGNIFGNIFEKVYGIKPEQADPFAISRTSMGRLKFLDDESMKALKKDKYLDNVLAARRKSMGTVDQFMSGYPNDGNAMGGFCKKIQEKLEKRGVKIKLQKDIRINADTEKIKVEFDQETVLLDHLVWAADTYKNLERDLKLNTDIDSFIHGTPMLFAVLVLKKEKIKDFTYMQNFSKNSITYRSSAAGIYSNQSDKNSNSFITVECPIKESELYSYETEEMTERIWSELKRLKVVSYDAELEESKIIPIKSSFKVPMKGFTREMEDFENEMRKFPNISVHSMSLFFRREMYDETLKVCRGMQ